MTTCISASSSISKHFLQISTPFIVVV